VSALASVSLADFRTIALTRMNLPNVRPILIVFLAGFVCFASCSVFKASSTNPPQKPQTPRPTTPRHHTPRPATPLAHTPAIAPTPTKYAVNDDSNALRKYLKPTGTSMDPKRRQALQNWLNQNENGVDVETFLISSKYASERSKAVAALPSLLQ